jgi:hypothetical protein
MQQIDDKTDHELAKEAFRLITTYTPAQLEYIQQLIDLI